MEKKYSSTLSLTSALNGGGWSTSSPSRFTPGKETRYPLCRRLGGPLSRSGRVRKISPRTGFDPRTVQPVESRSHTYIYIQLLSMRDLRQQGAVITYRLFGTTYQSHPECSRLNREDGTDRSSRSVGKEITTTCCAITHKSAVLKFLSKHLQKSSSHLKIMRATRVTSSQFHTAADPQTSVQNSVATATSFNTVTLATCSDCNGRHKEMTRGSTFCYFGVPIYISQVNLKSRSNR